MRARISVTRQGVLESLAEVVILWRRCAAWAILFAVIAGSAWAMDLLLIAAVAVAGILISTLLCALMSWASHFLRVLLVQIDDIEGGRS